MSWRPLWPLLIFGPRKRGIRGIPSLDSHDMTSAKQTKCNCCITMASSFFPKPEAEKKKLSQPKKKAPHRKTDHGTFRGFRRKDFLVQEMLQTKWHSSMFKPIGSCNLLCATGLVIVFLRLSWGFLPTPTSRFMDDAIKKPLHSSWKDGGIRPTTIIYPEIFVWTALVHFSSIQVPIKWIPNSLEFSFFLFSLVQFTAKFSSVYFTLIYI